MVVAHTSDPDIFYSSLPDSGYSIDNSACAACHVESENIGESSVPSSTDLQVNYPNPFRLTTTIDFSISEIGLVSLTVFDVLGRPIRVLTHGTYWPGRYSVTFDAGDLSSGVYIYSLTVGSVAVSRRMLLVR